MRRTILLSGVLPFLAAFLGGILAFSLVTAPQATAQANQLQEVRASAFTLVGPDGTVLARLAPGPQGPGNLALNDTAGIRRLALTGAGVLTVFDADGTTTRFRSGSCVEHCVGGAALNGIELNQDGTVRSIPPVP
jgi:hypothetical protein